MTTILAFDPRIIEVEHTVMVLPLSNRDDFTYMNVEDYEKVKDNVWRGDSKGYVVTALNGTTVRLHRMIMNTSKGILLDHKNHNKRDNTRSNLREATDTENQWNVPKTKRHTSSKYKGVHFRKDLKINKWTARGSLNGKRIHLGHHFTEEEAALEYNKFATKHYGEFACLNKIEDVD